MSEVLRRHQVYQTEELAFAKSRLDSSLAMARETEELQSAGRRCEAGLSLPAASVFLMWLRPDSQLRGGSLRRSFWGNRTCRMSLEGSSVGESCLFEICHQEL